MGDLIQILGETHIVHTLAIFLIFPKDVHCIYACPAKRGLSYFENSVDPDELAGKILINSFLVRDSLSAYNL